MFTKIQRTFARMVATFAIMLLPMAVPVVVHAQGTTNGGVNCGAQINFQDQNCGTTDTSGNVSNLINIFSLIVGAISIIMIIIGGFRYITSGGESSSVSGAKNTIIYALIGLV